VPVETVLLATADGLTLEGDAFLPAEPWAAAVVAHPHPQYGGDRHNVVVAALARGLYEAGVATIRFDFRGVGRSEGEHGGGVDERLDVAAAIEVAAPFAGDEPLLVAGYSFGAVVALNVVDPRLTAWLAVAPALVPSIPEPLAAADHRPKLLLAPEHDQFATADAVAERAGTWRATTVEAIPMADHFLGAATARVAERAVSFLRSLTQGRNLVPED
jgi:alpha/beta superfamily hydrolase